ncbi:MAG TPA: formate C-acetyltransferase/glycerol dehydratase family glycyl radical enzyme [Bacteroidales bacterium]|nr:formate C-acetyltransferase/glycerol dehydratase family glycyl radical enzyme [Bacteroidales bacterium]
MIKKIQDLKPDRSILKLRSKTLSAKRYFSVDQAKIITRVYKENKNATVILKRSLALARSLSEIPIAIDPQELIVGNRTPDIRAGVVFPEAGLTWLLKELDTLPSRPQDPFNVRKKDAEYFKKHIEPYWRGKTLENDIHKSFGDEIKAIERVVKINQKDHAQGHICPNVGKWLKYGPAGLVKIASDRLEKANNDQKDFYKSVCITLNASCQFIRRYNVLATEMIDNQSNNKHKDELKAVAHVCNNIAENPPLSFREAIQSLWFLFVVLQMESNASSFSPGRMDQYLYPFFINDLKSGKIDLNDAIKLVDALFIKFNQIVYMRNTHSAKYFAGFPIGFNITIGGQFNNGDDATNDLSYLILKAQDHIRMPQPNLTVRIHKKTSDKFLSECSRVIGLGTGMPQIVNDESIIPALESAGIDHVDSMDYALVGCVELSTQGNFLGWSDAAMFNMVKVLELTLNNGRCMITGEEMGLRTGNLPDYPDYIAFESAFRKQIGFFIKRMIKACEIVERNHQEHLPSPFLSAVIDNCLSDGIDVTAGGAKYNLSGIQAIQVANIADSLAVLKKLVFDERVIEKESLLSALQENFAGNESLRQFCINHAPKYGNDIEVVDELAAKWVALFADELKQYTNLRGGAYQMGLYTVSAHVPMGQNVGATPDGRLAQTPLADGGLSPMYGRDKSGPTAVLNSVSRIPSQQAGNGTLLNMKFLPSLFNDKHDRNKFNSLLKSFIYLPIHHVQFNVVTTEELIMAKADPESYRGLTIRVAGYTAYFTELAEDLQDEIIKRTTHG